MVTSRKRKIENAPRRDQGEYARLDCAISALEFLNKTRCVCVLDSFSFLVISIRFQFGAILYYVSARKQCDNSSVCVGGSYV